MSACFPNIVQSLDIPIFIYNGICVDTHCDHASEYEVKLCISVMFK